jgi:hypothetical protein
VGRLYAAAAALWAQAARRGKARVLKGLPSGCRNVPEVLARVMDGSRFVEYKPLYGTSLVTGWA